jgi:uncharacterized membrane protein YesL
MKKKIAILRLILNAIYLILIGYIFYSMLRYSFEHNNPVTYILMSLTIFGLFFGMITFAFFFEIVVEKKYDQKNTIRRYNN